MPGAVVETMPGLGHLAHEEDPDGTAAAIDHFAARIGLFGASLA